MAQRGGKGVPTHRRVWLGRRTGVLACLLVLLAAGCLGGGTGDVSSAPTGTATATPADTATPALESLLVQYLDATNRTAFARDHDVRTRDGAVLVVVELEPGRTLPGGYDVAVQSRRDDAVEAYVAAADLRPLAAHRNVSFVRTPHALRTDSLDS